MKAISPVLPSHPELPESVFAADQPECLPLPAVKVGYQIDPDQPPAVAVISRYELTPEEILAVHQTGTIWLEVYTFGQALQPQRLTVHEPLTEADG